MFKFSEVLIALIKKIPTLIYLLVSGLSIGLTVYFQLHFAIIISIVWYNILKIIDFYNLVSLELSFLLSILSTEITMFNLSKKLKIKFQIINK